MSRIYLDSCIVIYLIEGPDDTDRELVQLFASHVNRNEVFVSDLTQLECLVRPMRERRDSLISVYRHFFDRPAVRFIPPSKRVFETATHLRAESRLKTPDALHLAFAMEGGCGEFWTNDLHLQKAVGDRIRMVIPVEVG